MLWNPSSYGDPEAVRVSVCLEPDEAAKSFFLEVEGLHRDIQNMPGHSNHALALGEYTGGRVWIEDDEGGSTAWLEDKKGGRELRGRWLDMHDKPVSFDARRYHKVEPHEGSVWALAAYVPQAYARATEQHRQAQREAGFPLPEEKAVK